MKNLRYICLGSLLFIILVLYLCYKGYLWPNSIFASSYAIHGIDVSNYQGDFDWKQLSKDKKIKFAYIKATEGSNYKDKYFQKNWESASEAGIYKGAYHYFTTKSSGIEQAKNFIEVVPVDKGCLPPVIDIEEADQDVQSFKKNLTDYINIVEKKYNQTPILYVVYSTYEKYIKGNFYGYAIWIRDIATFPRLGNDKQWIFWQYCSRGRTKDDRIYIDLNVFNGDLGQLKILLSK